MIWGLFLVIAGGALMWRTLRAEKRKNIETYLSEANTTLLVSSMESDKQAIDLKSLTEDSIAKSFKRVLSHTTNMLGKMAGLKITAYLVSVWFVAMFFNSNFLRAPMEWVGSIVLLVSIPVGYLWLSKREKKRFDGEFPDALNMLAGAVSAGESITHAIMFVGRSLDGCVGKEFKRMGERLQLGESPDSVFRKACNRFPYSEFQFFVITLRANLQRGGQLKEVISRLNRLMFESRAIEKKKYALTAEARTSAKIVAAIPFFFLFMLQFLSPENYQYVMFHPDGKPILYYVIISECVGLLIVWSLMRGVKS
ncbi:type II secretion system F family protein [Vibrio sp. SCSIO 43135]|uniref:type II secretion system F family protein n=1 Tax=Vibrio sp. SCSIO 43135 TaxID=2819096 RepID=UPI0020754636|nr:type II secretion system F family protein [Vibrio sp. SCSIO 43135]USD40137.1 type II secretion system F family protein [Vibrio sp. SCSIO 43135]